MEEIRNWLEKSPYSRFLGMRLESIDETGARIALPYKDENSNPGKALHGGCAASLGSVCGHAVARAALGPDTGPWHTVQMQLNYLELWSGECTWHGVCVVNGNARTPDLSKATLLPQPRV
ncbi:MAG: PaaI family thioesterase [bacterium]|nr:PaaI family thioesterase [bacterium]